ncbi:MAG: hypothetical protein R3D05_03240 [Dongiaceae bacterium]
MRALLLVLLSAALAVPELAAADGAPPPTYPPGWDCSAVPAGAERQACNLSHLDPPLSNNPKPTRNQQNFSLPDPQPPQVPTGRPPTVPHLPGTIDTGN